MTDRYSYACKDYPGMESCPFHVQTESREELWSQMELHARLAHDENPAQWSDEDRRYLATLVKSG